MSRRCWQKITLIGTPPLFRAFGGGGPGPTQVLEAVVADSQRLGRHVRNEVLIARAGTTYDGTTFATVMLKSQGKK